MALVLLTGYDCADSDGRDGESTDASEARNRQAKTTESGSRGEYSTETVFSQMKGKSGDLRRIPLDRLRKTLGYRVCEKRRSYSVRRAAGLKIRVHRSAARRSGIYS